MVRGGDGDVMPGFCSNCRRATPTCELIAYAGACEDCRMNGLPDWRSVQAVSARHDLNRDGCMGTRGGDLVHADPVKWQEIVEGD